jgi:hypothetical protein
MFEAHVDIYAIPYGPSTALFRAENLQGIQVQTFVRDELREYCANAFDLLPYRGAARPGRLY